MGELVGGGYTLLYVYYLVWYTDLGGRGVFRRLTSLLLMLRDHILNVTLKYKIWSGHYFKYCLRNIKIVSHNYLNVTRL